jgi:glycosyltransferase involved in cell wall biosynthesis
MTRPDVFGRADRLLVIIPDRLSELIKKGEITERYYNPGQMFREVHILMTNDDRPDRASLQKTVGQAELFLHNLPADVGLFVRTLGWQRPLLGRWISRGLEIVHEISPQLVRTHNNFLEGYLAKRIKDAWHIPYVVSLHGVWDRDPMISRRQRIMKAFLKKYEKISVQNADGVIAVYRPILRYARDLGAKNVHLIYNVVAGRSIRPKDHYHLCRPPRVITVNRQLKEKNPENIIRALKDIEGHYLLVGDGLYHERLVDLACRENLRDKIEFRKAIPNDELCAMLGDFDIMVSHCDYWGISKTTIEAALAGLPIVLNTHPQEPVPDLEGDWVMLCDNTPTGYGSAIRTLLESESLRSEYGKKARAHALAHFDPDKMEQDLVALYRDVLVSAASRESREPVS